MIKKYKNVLGGFSVSSRPVLNSIVSGMYNGSSDLPAAVIRAALTVRGITDTANNHSVD